MGRHSKNPFNCLRHQRLHKYVHYLYPLLSDYDIAKRMSRVTDTPHSFNTYKTWLSHMKSANSGETSFYYLEALSKALNSVAMAGDGWKMVCAGEIRSEGYIFSDIMVYVLAAKIHALIVRTRKDTALEYLESRFITSLFCHETISDLDTLRGLDFLDIYDLSIDVAEIMIDPKEIDMKDLVKRVNNAATITENVCDILNRAALDTLDKMNPGYLQMIGECITSDSSLSLRIKTDRLEKALRLVFLWCYLKVDPRTKTVINNLISLSNSHISNPDE
jgi:hypothetical protein